MFMPAYRLLACPYEARRLKADGLLGRDVWVASVQAVEDKLQREPTGTAGRLPEAQSLATSKTTGGVRFLHPKTASATTVHLPLEQPQS